jgi:hypothetical protein
VLLAAADTLLDILSEHITELQGLWELGEFQVQQFQWLPIRVSRRDY